VAGWWVCAIDVYWGQVGRSLNFFYGESDYEVVVTDYGYCKLSEFIILAVALSAACSLPAYQNKRGGQNSYSSCPPYHNFLAAWHQKGRQRLVANQQLNAATYNLVMIYSCSGHGN